MRSAFRLCLLCSLAFAPFLPRLAAAEDKTPSRAELVRTAVAELVKMQENGEWPYEGVFRVEGKIPIGYRVGGTAIVAGTILVAAPENEEARAAVNRGLDFVLTGLRDPRMEPSTREAYDVRVWGHAYALEFLCQVRAAKAAGDKAKQVEEWIPKLVAALITEEIDGGGWNYATRRRHASFVTAPVAQILLLARSQGEKVPDAVLERARKVLEAGRAPTGAFAYTGPSGTGAPSDKVPGSAARSAICETTLVLLGGGSLDDVRKALDIFHDNWDELAKRRAKPGTHEGEYRIAPYYFYYGHRHAAQAIEMLPEKEREKQRERLLKVLLKTRDGDGTWNDRVFPRTRDYGTAMAVLVLLGDKVPPPARWEKK
jgi:hypothetical protein